jgi:hypothetical protein
MLVLLGLEELASIDGKPLELFDEIPKGANYEEGIGSFKQHLIDRLEEQVKSGGVTIFLDYDRLRTGNSAELAQLVRERQTKEMENLEILLDPTIDLKPLWMTSTGFGSLHELKAGLECSVFFFGEVKKKIAEHGLKVRASSTLAHHSVNASEMMKQYLFDCARGNEKRSPQTE